MDITVAVEANIAAGKSTLLEHLRGCATISSSGSDWIVNVVEEPLSAVKDLLAKFYADKHRWAFTLQTVFLLERVRHIDASIRSARAQAGATANIVHVVERSPYSDRECFAKMLHEEGILEECEFVAYISCFDWKRCPAIDALVFLHVEPSECMRRMRERARPSERDVSMDYLEKLHSKHVAWLHNSGPAYTGIPISTLNGTQPMKTVCDDMGHLLQRIIGTHVGARNL